jgi:hypothetical protein
MDVYVSKDKNSDPTQFTHDIAFKQITSVRLNTQDISILGGQEGYSVTVYV